MIGFDKDNMNNDIDHVLVSEEQLRERIAEMGGAIPVIIAVATAAISGFLAIKLMLKIVKKVGMRWFAVYTFLLGAFMIAYQMFFAA